GPAWPGYAEKGWAYRWKDSLRHIPSSQPSGG
ncbi:MAG: hypothetical protein ACI9X4_002278, partial [Glaciecola sp.]